MKKPKRKAWWLSSEEEAAISCLNMLNEGRTEVMSQPVQVKLREHCTSVLEAKS
jgi:hypothetical protein